MKEQEPHFFEGKELSKDPKFVLSLYKVNEDLTPEGIIDKYGLSL